MGRLYLYYENHKDSSLGDVLKVKIDEKITTEILKNEIYEQDLDDSVHNIKMYFEGWTKDQLVGYIDQDIVIKGNTYYIYKTTLMNKGKLNKVDYDSPKEFKEKVSKINKKHKVLDWIYIVITLIIIILSIIIIWWVSVLNSHALYEVISLVNFYGFYQDYIYIY